MSGGDMETVKEITRMIGDDWMLILLVAAGILAVVRFFGITIAWDQEKKRIVFSPPIARKIDKLLAMTNEMQLDILALQIMNEHLLATERYKIWLKYKRRGGNGFVETYVQNFVIPIMQEELKTNENK
jgi:hypothetical protein